MESGGWIVVLVIIALALITGFVVNANYQLTNENQTAHVALEGSVEAVVTLNAQSTKDAETIRQIKATQTAEHNAWTQKEQDYQATLSAAQAEKATLTAQQGAEWRETGQDTGRGTAPQSEEPRASVSQPTPTPAGSFVMMTADMNLPWGKLPWLPTLGLGLFGMVVVAAYRLLKTEDQSQQGARAGKRTYAAGNETVYVRMTRREASSYAREQRAR